MIAYTTAVVIGIGIGVLIGAFAGFWIGQQGVKGRIYLFQSAVSKRIRREVEKSKDWYVSPNSGRFMGDDLNSHEVAAYWHGALTAAEIVEAPFEGF